MHTATNREGMMWVTAVVPVGSSTSHLFGSLLNLLVILYSFSQTKQVKEILSMSLVSFCCVLCLGFYCRLWNGEISKMLGWVFCLWEGLHGFLVDWFCGVQETAIYIP